MVFVPTHQAPVEPHEAAATPRRPEHVHIATNPDARGRLPWRAVVHASEQQTATTSWHLTGCTAPLDAAMHCPTGQQLIAAQQDPDGHCLIDGHCGRCQDASG
jgi:hypothetical protein